MARFLLKNGHRNVNSKVLFLVLQAASAVTQIKLICCITVRPNCESPNYITANAGSHICKKHLTDQIKIFQSLTILLIICIFLENALSYPSIWLENPKTRIDLAILLLFLFFSIELDSCDLWGSLRTSSRLSLLTFSLHEAQLIFCWYLWLPLQLTNCKNIGLHLLSYTDLGVRCALLTCISTS